MKAPDKIFLQACGSCPLEGDECKVCKFEELEEITWNTERVFKKDVEYIRKDALLEWLEERYKLTISNVGCYTGHSVWAEVIEHINEM